MKQFLLSFCVFSIFLLCSFSLVAQEVVINEVMASNGNTLADEDGDYEDWIELYNAGDEVVNLEGWGLSDDYDRPFRWVLPDMELRPGEFLLVWASNKDRNDPEGQLHTNYAISSSGEEVILTRPDGERMDEVSPRPIPRDLSWGRYPDGTDNWFYFQSATPGNPNVNPSYSGIVEPPVLSHEPGFYTESFLLEITHPDTNVTIYFTTDGSTPTMQSQQYTGPIEIYDRSGEENVFSMIPTNLFTPQTSNLAWKEPNGLVAKGSAIRILAHRPDFIQHTQNLSYFVFPEGVERYSLPVFSILTDSVNFFGYNEGIYVPGVHHRPPSGFNQTGNFSRRGIAWEREGGLMMFEPDGELAFSQNVGFRIHGGITRGFPQKSLRVYARRMYGENTIDYDVFQKGEYDSYKRLLLRNAGNDWHFGMMRDGIIQEIGRGLGLEAQEFRPAIVFLNGEYWGIHNIRERLDKHYLNRKFGVEEHEIDILTRGSSVKEGNASHWNAMINYVQSNDPVNPEVIEEMERRLDFENFLNYYSLQIYCGNDDWPQNNIDYWRKRVPFDPEAPYGHDGRWRFLTYDLDRTLGATFGTGALNVNMITWLNRNHNSTILFRRLMLNAEFRTSMINRIADHLNSFFRTENVESYIYYYQNVLEPEIHEHRERWISTHNWQGQVDLMLEAAEKRPQNVRNHLRNYYGIQSDISIDLDLNRRNAGELQINSLTINSQLPGVNPSSPYPWSGIYFHNIPVELSAEARAGFVFDYWTIAGDTLYEQNLTQAFQADVEIMAHFSVDTAYEYMPEPWVVSNCAYVFDYWPEEAEVGTFPDHMAFVYMDEDDPGLEAGIEGFTDGVYHLDSRTRINGLGEDGFSFINTGNADGNPGYPGRRLGGALLGISTLDVDELFVRWEGGTVTPNSRVYNLRLQYRIGDEGAFFDLLDDDGNPVEYQRNEEEGHAEVIGPVALPSDAMDQPYVQLLWRYYHTGEQLDDDSGARDQLRVGHIVVSTDSVALETFEAADFSPEIEISSGPACFDSAAMVPINVEVLSGIPELAWVMGGDTFFVAEDVQLFFPPGQYEYELIDGLGCTSSGSFEIQFSETIEIEWESEIPTCAGDEDGSITAHISGGTAPIFYEWSTGHASMEPDRFVLWDFNSKVPSDSPETTFGEGEALLIGGVNNPESGTNGSGSSDPASDNQAWQTTGYPSQGMAPRTAGVQFNISTEGYRDILFSFDQRLSNTAANTWVLLYTENRSADSVLWEEAVTFRVEPQLSGTGDTWYNERMFDFSEIEGMNDNPNVAFRIVSDFDPETGQYESARLDRNYSGGGTSRFDMVWAFGNPINRKTSITGLSAGLYSITVTDGLGCVWADSLELPDPEPVPVPVISGPTELESGQMADYDLSPEDLEDYGVSVEVQNGQLEFIGPEGLEIRWDEVETGEMLEGLIQVTLTDSLGCSAVGVLEVVIFGPSSTEDLSEGLNLNVFPNPNRGEFVIELENPEVDRGWSLELYSSSGALLQKRPFSSGRLQINLESSYRGLVKIVMRDDSGVVRLRDMVFIVGN